MHQRPTQQEIDHCEKGSQEQTQLPSQACSWEDHTWKNRDLTWCPYHGKFPCAPKVVLLKSFLQRLQSRMSVWSCLSGKMGCQCFFILAVLAPYFLVGHPGPDDLSAQLTPNRGRSCEVGDAGLMVKVPDYRYEEWQRQLLELRHSCF